MDAELGSLNVYPTHAGLAVTLILIADLLVIGFSICLMRLFVFRRWRVDLRIRRNLRTSESWPGG